MNDDYIKSLRAEEVRCLKKFNLRAKRYMSENPKLELGVARGMAVRDMPRAFANYSEARATLTAMMIRPLDFDEV